MAKDDAQERNEDPTQKRLQQAKEKGQTPKSKEISTILILLASGVTFIWLGSGIFNGFRGLFSSAFQIDRNIIFDHRHLMDQFIKMMFDALYIIGPFLFILVLVAIISPFFMGSVTFSWEVISLKFEKLDPIQGMKKHFSMNSLMEIVKAVFKLIIVGVVYVVFMLAEYPYIISLGTEDAIQGILNSGHSLVWGFIWLSLSLVIVVFFDVPFQFWNHTRELRMTRQELKDEFKDTDGRPEVKAKIKSIQREVARRRMMAEVGKADVVIVNPAHFACALRYKPESMAAPILVAKGVELIALQIKKIAQEQHIPIVSAPPLARSIFYYTKLNQEIPAGLYIAVAQVLAYIFQLKQSGILHIEKELEMGDLPIPDDMQRY